MIMTVEPSVKSTELSEFFEVFFGRTTAIKNQICTCCGGRAISFLNKLSRREYSISGLCQECQGEVFDND